MLNSLLRLDPCQTSEAESPCLVIKIWKIMKGKWRRSLFLLHQEDLKETSHKGLITGSHCLNRRIRSAEVHSELVLCQTLWAVVYICAVNSNCVYNCHHLLQGTCLLCSSLMAVSALTANFCFSYLFAVPGELFSSYFFSHFITVLRIFILVIMKLFALVLLHIVRAPHSRYAHLPFSHLIMESQEKSTFSLLLV